MCRIYKAKAGWYVRLCYYHKERKGEHVPVPKGFELKTRHYPKQRQLGRRSSSTKQPVKRHPRRCVYCNLCLSRHNTTGVCVFCTEHPERRPRRHEVDDTQVFDINLHPPLRENKQTSDE